MTIKKNKKNYYRAKFFGENIISKKPIVENNYRKCVIKTGDIVQVITGKEKTKKGKVIDFDRKTGRIKIEGLNMRTHFSKQTGIQVKEGSMHVSNVMLIDSSTGKITRVKKNSEGERVAIKTNQVL